MTEENYVNDVVEELKREEEEEFKGNIERCIRNIANLQKRKLDVDKQLSEAKEEFKTLKMQATNFADLLS